MRVLIVEDEPSAREASARFLSHCGYSVDAAASAPDAVACADEHSPDVVICDWRLGGAESGVDVARELQQKYDSRIVFVTAYPLDDLRDAARELRVAHFLRKPISLPGLAAIIASLDRKTDP